MRKLLPLAICTLLVVGARYATLAHASDQPLCQLTLFTNPDGGASPQGPALNSCNPPNQDGGYGNSAAVCTGIGPRMTLGFQTSRSGYLQLTTSKTKNATAAASRHLNSPSAALTSGSGDGVVLQPVGSGEVCISFLPDLDADGGFAANQTLKVFNETSAPSFTDNGFNPSSR